MAVLSVYMVWQPNVASAGLFSNISEFFFGTSNEKSIQIENSNSQNVPLLQNYASFDANAAIGGSEIVVVNNEALLSENGPAGTSADIGDSETTGQISRYIVRKGDSLSSIATMFGVSKNTIIWANNIPGGTVKEGDILVILPVSGTIHTITKNDTISTIAKKYKADVGEILAFNGLTSDDGLTIGDSIVIPDGEGITKSAPAKKPVAKKSGYSKYLGGSGPSLGGYYIRPLIGGVKTQGLHGWNAVDIGTPIGTRLMAAAAGEVIIAKSSGWNGGYGDYVVISHPNGTQTVYGHMSKVYVKYGQYVSQGETIGLSGNTGNSTGPHVHFEIRGAVNPF